MPTPDTSISALCKRGELPRAAAMLFAAHGAEVLSFLEVFLDPEAARSAFGGVQEQAILELASVDADAVAFRSWLFGLAHLAHVRAVGAPESAASARLPKSGPRAKAGFETLPLDDQHLLVLRLDRGLRFDEIAEVLHGATSDEPLRRRWADALRARCAELEEQLTRASDPGAAVG